MKEHVRLLAALGFLLAVFFVSAAAARAQDAEEQIRILEGKLSQLDEQQNAMKSEANAALQELSKLREQQIEMKKEATEAAAALPTFEYRPGNGLNIQGADKAWGLRFTIESHFRYEFESGRASVGRTRGELMGRRFRPGVLYCINNCLWEIEATLDLDGFGTGNGKNSTNTATSSILQRGVVNFHGENLHPWLPTLTFGMDLSTSGMPGLSRQGSSAVGAQAEYDLLTRNNGFNTGRAGQGFTLTWDDRSLSAIGIPGRIGRFQVGRGSIGEGDDGLSSFKNKSNYNVYGNIQPFSQVKNKWISGLTFEYGAWFCNVDKRANENGCSRFRIQDHGDGGRQTLFDTGAGSVGKGLTVGHGPGVVYNVGPYTLRVMGSWSESEDGSCQGTGTGAGISGTNCFGKKRAHDWLIGNDLFLWSPKGFLTGSASTPGSILVGTHFERTDISCGDRIRACNNGGSVATINGGQFNKDAILLREWDLWYFVAPRMSVGMNWLWYNASNLRTGPNQAAQNLGVCPSGNCRPGIGGDWVDVFLNWRYTF